MKINNNNCRKLLLFEVYFVLFSQLLIDLLGFPQYILFITDVINICIMLFMLIYPKSIFSSKYSKLIKNYLLVYIVYLLIDSMLNLVSPLLFLWGARKFLRGFFFFVACIRFLHYSDYKKFLDRLYWLQIINVILSSYQFLVLGLKQDHLGGIFGTASGCNAFSNLFFCTITCYYIASFLKDKSYMISMLFVVMSSLILSALAELKVFYIEFIVILVIILFVSRFSLKKLTITIVSIISFIFSLKLFERYFPDFYLRMVNITSFIAISNDVGTGYNISRGHAFAEINDLFFNTIFQRLFGLGLGGAETSPFSFLISDFYKRNGNLNYVWFGHAITYLETGIVGVSMLLVIYFLIGFYGFKVKNTLKNYYFDGIFCMTFAAIIIFNFFYNNFIRADIQYFVYFLLAMPFVIVKGNKLKSSIN